jgi:hypothetical protein
VVAIPVRNSSRAGYGWPTVAELPAGMSLVAAVWSSRRARGLVVARSDGSVHSADWDGRLGAQLASSAPLAKPHEVFTASWPERLGWQVRGQWFEPDAGCVDSELITARAFGSWVGGVKEGERLGVLLNGARRVLTVPNRPERVWLSWEGALAASCLYSERIDVHTLRGQEVSLRSLPRPLFVNHMIQGVLAGPKVGEAVILALHVDRRTIQSLAVDTVAPQWREEVRARASIMAVAVAPHGRYLAWRDVDGEVAIYSRDRSEVVLRLHVGNVSVERS